MLIPQYTIRLLLILTAVCAVVFSIVGLAISGRGWAAGVSVAIGAVVVAMLVYAMLFAVVWMFSAVAASLRRGGQPGRSPFRQAAQPGTPGPRRTGSPFQTQ